VAEWECSLESMGMTLFNEIYRGRRVLLTGHTGFKGSWLALWLTELGAEVIGVSLPPNSIPSHWNLLKLCIDDNRQDIRDAKGMVNILQSAKPDVVFHLAAQPLVRYSYKDPMQTWSTNVMGTVNLLEACRDSAFHGAIVIITSDKCYENREWIGGYREEDRLGGHDPYSASKAAVELVAGSYRQSFFNAADTPLLATARAGNVIGGGDWSTDRLIPDIVRAQERGEILEIRSPQASRPWQHVLDALSGYLLLGQKLLEGQKGIAEAWNFGPNQDGIRTVEEVLAVLKSDWASLIWQQTHEPQPHETNLLQLDNTKARLKLGWEPVWSFEEALAATGGWYRTYLDRGEIISRLQLRDYISQARAGRLNWAGD
jgi:CDP-glucose 4,6-dehydratase